jgi:glycosyltransferase involved in cell wall biosynthesis
MVAAAPRLLNVAGTPLRFDPDLDVPLVGPSVLALVGGGGNQDACNMWRIWAPFAMLQLHGYPAEWGWKNDIAVARTAAPLAKVHIICRAGGLPHERKQTGAWFKMMRGASKTVVYECDDDLFSPFMVEQQRKRVASGADAKSVEQLELERQACVWCLQQCDGVTVTTQYLASTVRRFTDKPVEVVPNAIDAEWFTAVQALGERKVLGLTIGWAGGQRPDADLVEMAVAWGRIAERYPHVTFVVMGAQRYVVSEHVPEHRLHRVPWMDVREYPQGLLNFDIGCCPLENRNFNRSKSPIKAYEYAMSGAAVVASPTVYQQCITDGRNGLLATTAEEWEAALSSLVEQEERRRHLAATLKADVLARWSLKKNYRRWPEAWQRIVEGGS